MIVCCQVGACANLGGTAEVIAFVPSLGQELFLLLTFKTGGKQHE